MDFRILSDLGYAVHLKRFLQINLKFDLCNLKFAMVAPQVLQKASRCRRAAQQPQRGGYLPLLHHPGGRRQAAVIIEARNLVNVVEAGIEARSSMLEARQD
jgi:hypothetical protein